MDKTCFFFRSSYLITLALTTSCGLRQLPPPIGNNMSFPGAIVADTTSSFLLLNTSANDDYSDGSIHRYAVDIFGNISLSSVFSVKSHGTELTTSSDGKLVALSFDDSKSDTELQFLNYSNSAFPLISQSITLPSTGGKQTIKRLGTFTRTADANNYYVYGTIITSANLDGTFANIPPRTFLTKVKKDFSSAPQLLFILSYGLNDPLSLVKQSTASDSLKSSISIPYTFGFEAPTYDSTHDLFIAFPTGTMGNLAGSSINSFPVLPEPLSYFGNSNYTQCTTIRCPDFRAVSLAAVLLTNIDANKTINESTFFVPLGWNQNGIPYAAKSNGIDIVASNINLKEDDIKSFSFQNRFWSSYWANSVNAGTSAATCYPSTATITGNQYGTITDNSLFVVKNGTNATINKSDNSSSGKTGYGGEIFLINGLDVLNANINSINTARNAASNLNTNDFSSLAPYQLIDPYNTVTNLNANWLLGSASGTPKNAGPLTFYMYSRTSNIDLFKNINSAVPKMSVLNFGGSTCRPYWYRMTANVSTWGLDSSWLGNNFKTITPSNTFPGTTNDPTAPDYYSFPSASGAQLCTDVSFVSGTPKVFCVNFLTSEITKYNVSSTNSVFTPF
ncbi:hypothetical protein [Fluviispira multicolorata]|uniref:Lipoprotein n=1 Tax=Fluviispira multicolorata TaxID=2654512 RepID=A0A833JF91_9BACT|nr:hypothetical protein [Fluviispira multicolorata]KAB8030925.1 hypothetical protein GCL57_08105 [Fluviispira multicolorata]